jgi:hypothetical protein
MITGNRRIAYQLVEEIVWKAQGGAVGDTDEEKYAICCVGYSILTTSRLATHLANLINDLLRIVREHAPSDKVECKRFATLVTSMSIPYNEFCSKLVSG